MLAARTPPGEKRDNVGHAAVVQSLASGCGTRGKSPPGDARNSGAVCRSLDPYHGPASMT